MTQKIFYVNFKTKKLTKIEVLQNFTPKPDSFLMEKEKENLQRLGLSNYFFDDKGNLFEKGLSNIVCTWSEYQQYKQRKLV